MARKPRLYYFDAIYHVMLRGNNGQNIFFSESDRCRLSLLIQQATYRYGCLIHGFCFMNNHVHFMIQVKEVSLSKIMQNIAFRYTRWINKKQKRIGHLFQARFKAILITNESYLLQLVRYIHLNPVEAGLVKSAKDYRWSGHRTYLGTDNFLWLTTDWMLSQFSITNPRKAYAEFVDATSDVDEKEFLTEPKREITSSPFDTCTTTFEEIISFVYQRYQVDEKNKIKVKYKAIIAWLSIEYKVCTMLKVAQFFRCDLSNISRKLRVLQNVNQEELDVLKVEFLKKNVKCQA